MEEIKEIPLEDLNPESFVGDKVREIKAKVGDGLKTYFIHHGLMREGEPGRVVRIFKDLGVDVELADAGAFQCMAILHGNRVTGMRNGQRDYGHQIEVRCWDTKNAITASPTRLPFGTLERLAERLTGEVPGVVSVTYGIAKKPPSTMEVV